VARIIHVEDQSEWIDVVRRALADHDVDSARTWDQALALLRGPDAYELALIDLNLGNQDERAGGEILDLLRVDFPRTRRVVITAVPPAGDLRSRIYDRYGVEDIIIKDKTTLPDLQLVVRRALKREANQVSSRVNELASALRERCRDWRLSVQDEIQASLIEAESNAMHAGRRTGQAAEEARTMLDGWRSVRDHLAGQCSQLDSLIAAAKTIDDVTEASDQLDRAMRRITDEMDRLRQ